MGKSAARQFLVSIAGVSGFWARKTGGHPSSSVTKAWDGGAVTPDVLASPADYDDITVSRPYDPARDAPIAASLRGQVGSFRTTISQQPTDEHLIVIPGSSTTYVGLLSKVSEPDVDAGSSTEARIELTFAIQGVQ